MGNLLVFHQGFHDSGRLWCNGIQSQAWQGDVQTPNTGMTASPSAVEFNGKLYCFHQGFSKSGEFYCNVYDGMVWQGDFPPLGAGAHVTDSPSAVVFKGQIYCFFQGAGEDGRLYAVSSSDGTNWSIAPNQPASNTYLTNSPSAVVWGDQIYVFHQGRDGRGRPDGTMWYNKYDGSQWDQDRQVPIDGMSASPSAVVYNNTLYVFHQHSHDDGKLYVFNVTNWGPDLPISKTMLSSSPAAAVFNGRLYCFHQGAGDNGQLWCNVFDESTHTWGTDTQVPNTGMSSSPCALSTSLPPPPAAVVAPNPSETRVASFDGWGTSLCWWANQYGGAPGKYGASYLADLIFGSGTVRDPKGDLLPGLGINIVRYNIGGGGGGATIDKDTVELVSPKNPVDAYPYHYIWGFWKKWGPDPDEYDTSNPEYWDWNVDANQRAMLTLARDRGANVFEFFSNSPPWWMCRSHSSSGGDLLSAISGNLQSWNIEKFAKYLVTVVQYAHDHWGIDVSSIEPFNEPDPPSWYLVLPNGVLSSQEGCNFGCNLAAKLVAGVLQQDVIDALHVELNNAGLQARVALTANDSNSVVYALENFTFFVDQSPDILKKIKKFNVHGYGGDDGLHGLDPYRGTLRPALRKAIRDIGAQLWMSEVGDGDKTGMTMATSIMLDLAELWPSAWVLWQVVDPNWGLFENSTSDKEVIGAPKASYYVFAQCSRHLTKGCKIIGDITTIGNDDNVTLADLKSIVAYDAGNRKLVIVTLNLERGRWITYDLSTLPTVAGPVESWETTGDGTKKYKFNNGVELKAKKFRFRCDPNSVCTFEIQGVTL